ncbi:hypothetical protein AJ79_00816 [Helicocarpus griseus UAMH5409]|uniref:Uncharacterized protein n=1 Tax=Helicocarpus griseus UAMH5409 TaxID=1447875 RepID=A0A2B7YBD6_9EURO|nr:hypothetical protein AJ79_00816 [Helicocarpus griseus UAMH5409]
MYCWLCGDCLEFERMSLMSSTMPPFIRDNQEWKDEWEKYSRVETYPRRRFSIDAQDSDIDFEFSCAQEWTFFYRAIVLNKEHSNKFHIPKEYRLSGIAYIPGGRTVYHRLLAPCDPKAACLGAGEPDSKTLQLYPIRHPFSDKYNYPEDDGWDHLEGYVIHSRCWNLIDHALGKKIASSRLESIAAALRDQWDGIIASEACGGKSGSVGFSKFRDHHSLFNNDIENRRDPFFIQELDILAWEAEQLVLLARDRASGLEDHNDDDLTSSNSTVFRLFKYKVPLEIKYLIADHLSLADTRRMLMAFGDTFDVNFWKWRVPSELLFEFKDDLKDSSSSSDGNDSNGGKMFAWDYVAAEIERRGVLSWPGVKNRRRILNMLNPVVESVLGAVSVENEPEVDDQSHEPLYHMLP